MTGLDMTDIRIPLGVKIGSTITCSAMNVPGRETPLTKSVKSCVTWAHDSVSGMVKEMVGIESPDSLFPLDKGLIERDEHVAPTVEIIKKLGAPLFGNVVAAVPAMELQRGHDRLEQAINIALSPTGLRLCSEVYCGAVNALGAKKVFESNFLALNLGSTTTEVLICLFGEMKYLNAFTDVCGNRVDYELLDATQKALGKVIATKADIRYIKEQHDLTAPREVPIKVLVRGEITEQCISKPIQTVLFKYTNNVAMLVKSILANNLDRETISMVLDSPIILTGGMENIKGLPLLLENMLRTGLNYDGISVLSQNDGHIAPALGALKLTEVVPWDKVS